MKVLDLFSGIGGFSLGLERAGMETVAFCEYDEKCRKVLKKHWPDVPQYNDVRTLTGEQLKNDGITTIDVLTGGYPCQPFSLAGVRKGEDDDRHLWPEVKRLIQEIRPTWVLCENVAGHISMGLGVVLADLEAEGYQSQVFLIPACAVNAPHRRDRVWILGHSAKLQRDGRDDNRKYSRLEEVSESRNTDSQAVIAHTNELTNGQQYIDETTRNNSQRTVLDVADSISKRGCSGETRSEDASDARQSSGCPIERGGRIDQWDIEPTVGRVASGIPNRVDRLKQLGNAVVPQIPEMFGRAIMNA